MQNWIIESLQKSGSKITGTRQAIASHLVSENQCTFKVAALIAALPSLDRVSIYRTIDLLASLDVIHPTVVLGGNQYYELHEHGTHHHHSFCGTCGQSTCVTCPVAAEESTHHTLFYTAKQCVGCT